MRDIGFGVLGAILLIVSLLGAAVVVNRGPSTPPESGPSASASVAASATVSPGPDIRDADFLAALGGQVTSVSPGVAEGMGRRVCSALDEGTPIDNVRRVLVQKGVTPAEASRITLAAVTMYCAENHDKVIP
jgi:hypothetical protein